MLARFQSKCGKTWYIRVNDVVAIGPHKEDGKCRVIMKGVYTEGYCHFVVTEDVAQQIANKSQRA